ncbi:ubiquitin carboxyl-terminal hydrolase 34 [Podospora conica]|nr:ubiquitin carboxyl-terminal hydrolase 34 [Schizothecium conicum]
MRVDTDPTTPTTPETPFPASRPPHGNHSSNVTINVRTPSRPYTVVASPTSTATMTSGTDPAEAVHASVEEPEVDMSCQDDSVGETPESFRSDSNSPPVEVIPLDSDDSDADYDEIVIDRPSESPCLRTLGQSQPPDPSSEFPFQDPLEPSSDAIIRLTTYIIDHENVARSVAEWIDQYLNFAKNSTFHEVLESWQANRTTWSHLPDLVMTVLNHKRQPTTARMMPEVRHEVLKFFRQFARLTAFFIEMDSKALREGASADPSWTPEPISPLYCSALGQMTRGGELFPREENLFGSALDDWGCDVDVAEVLDTFQAFHKNQGGVLAYIKQLAISETALLGRFPKLNEHLAHLSVPVCNIMFLNNRRTRDNRHQDIARVEGNTARAYAFFKRVSAALANIIDKHVNHLSLDTAQLLIPTLCDIYNQCLTQGGLAELVELKATNARNHPHIPHLVRPEVIALHWKFLLLRKLIVSSQMQLRVLAVSSMCSDLVSIWRRFGDGTGYHNRPVIDFFSNFLLETGLVTYILGPTCHPEITLESSNIVGFLGVSGTYSKAHTDAVWQTITSSQNQRVLEALVRMMIKVSTLLTADAVLYLSEKVLSLPVESFGPTMRELWDTINKQMHRNQIVGPQALGPTMASYELCARLLRHASVPGKQFPVAHPELQEIAMQRLIELVGLAIPDALRQHIYRDCLDDIGRKTPYTAGSLWILHLLLRNAMNRDLGPLTTEHDLPRLLVDELEATIPIMRAAGCTTVLSGALNKPRLDLLTAIIQREPTSISKDLGQRLWNLMVGPGAASREDREVAWHILNMASKPGIDGLNPFVGLCFSDCFPLLPKEYFCPGALEFVHAQLKPALRKGSSIFYQDGDQDSTGIGQLWRLLLTAPVGTIEREAITILVRDVYLDSDCILAFSQHQALKVHLSLLDRCLNLLSSAATKLKDLPDDSANGDSHPMEGREDKELEFIRSLSVLREFHQRYHVKPHFSQVLDVRQLTGEPPNEILGDSAELKYQCFDGEAQTESQALRIGRRNTLGDLLAALREATGFRDYRIYYRGCPFVPRRDDIGKTLEDCRVHDGNLLIQHVADSPEALQDGILTVEGKILAHFKNLWGCLSLKGTLYPAQAVYHFLINLPVDPSILRAIEDPTTPYLDLFPPGEPLKTLYVIRALRHHLAIQRQKSTSSQLQQYLDDPETNDCQFATSVGRAMTLLISVISDQGVMVDANHECCMDLSCNLLAFFVELLTDPFLPASAAELLDAPLLDTLVGFMSTLLSAHEGTVRKFVELCLQSIFTICSMSPEFMAAFRTHDNFRALLGKLLVLEERAAIRQTAATLIEQRVLGQIREQSSNLTRCWREYFWPVVSELLPNALMAPAKSNEVMSLCVMMFATLILDQPEILQLQHHLDDWLMNLVHYTTYEDATKPDIVDSTASNLLKLLELLLYNDMARQKLKLPSGISRKIFWTQMFPPFDSHKKFAVGAHNKQIHSTETRAMMVRVILALVKDDTAQLAALLNDLNQLVPVYGESDDWPYAYDLAVSGFERSKAIRAPCGYAGIKNLSNTCYFGSLLAQLYMNIDFRRFVLGTHGSGPDRALLFETRKLFGHMQNSLARFVAPDELVKTIRTYDEAELDIHNQMDVDEFYNLWNDRLEGQFSNSAERSQFRSFYGGQLVQQVASKECDHISERLEPFSAIQCDIKGKSSLQESLQTYVGGEIMEGENRYNCSQCDRHVDAVKRTCLKVIPDNLIFHLKRFDFNLRQMQRNKINDRFAFPEKIDMRPYTIEHLSNSPEGKDEDMFELVGVLVHSGTAESGHYYSYARERPSSSDSPAWMEFNDDVVTPWDPALMESSCFGGIEHRDQFDGVNGPMDKTYSAYMLFYQRSSSLAKNQALLEQTRLPSPMAVAVPLEMARVIDDENIGTLRRHCIYDASQISFVNMTLNRLREHYDGCSPRHEMETTGICMALSFLDQVASRAKDLSDFFKLANHIGMLCRPCGSCSMVVYQYLVSHRDVFRFLVQRTPDPEVRRVICRLILDVLGTLKMKAPLQYGLPAAESPQPDGSSPTDSGSSDGDSGRLRGVGRLNAPQFTVMVGVMKMFQHLWDCFHLTLRAWPEVFDFQLAFVQMGPHEMRAFLRRPFLLWLLYIIWADPNLDMPIQFIKMINTVHRRIPSRQPSYEAIISLADALTKGAKLVPHAGGRFWPPQQPSARFQDQEDPDGPYPYTSEEARVLEFEWGPGAGNFFVDRLLVINQNQAATHSIITNLIKQNRTMEASICRTLVNNISGMVLQGHPNEQYLAVASQVFCRHASQPELVGSLVRHVSQQCMSLRNLEGKAFLAFQIHVFDAPQENTGWSLQQIVSAGYANIPEWAPGLLGYSDPDVVKDTEMFLRDKLFGNFAAPTAADGDEDWITDAVARTARQLGVKCLEYLRVHFIVRGVDVPLRLVAGLERTVTECSKFYDGMGMEDDDFIQMRDSTLDSLRQMTVEENEEDGDGMYYSDSSSIGSSNTAG